jgi:hypothetical protein
MDARPTRPLADALALVASCFWRWNVSREILRDVGDQLCDR